jgi:hypothetical protein
VTLTERLTDTLRLPGGIHPRTGTGRRGERKRGKSYATHNHRFIEHHDHTWGRTVVEEKTRTSRPLAISIVAVCSFLIGFVGTIAGMLLGLLLLRPQPQSVSTSFVANSTFLTLLWLMMGPSLVCSSYNLYKMKKWAAQAVAAIILFDLVASPLFLIASQSLIDATDFLGWSLDIVLLLLLAYARNAVFAR